MKPNLFIVGAAKCGTTSMHHYLSQHPEIFMQPGKEPHFFGRDLDINADWRISDPRRYERSFGPAGDAKIRGEASTWYLFSRTAAGEIREYAPDARILIMLRNPVDFINSLHYQMINTANEDIYDLRKALDAESERRAGRGFPDSARFRFPQRYREAARFSEQVERYYNAFSPDAVRVLLLDDLKENPKAVIRETLQFLGVDPSFEPDMAVQNRTRNANALDLRIKRLFYDSSFFRKLARKAPEPLLNTYRRLVGWFGKGVREVRMPDDLRRQLLHEFSPEITRLESLIGRDLSHWRAHDDAFPVSVGPPDRPVAMQPGDAARDGAGG